MRFRFSETESMVMGHRLKQQDELDDWEVFRVSHIHLKPLSIRLDCMILYLIKLALEVSG